MRKLTRKSLDELAMKMPVINEATQRIYIGGYKPSCVFNCFDYIDGDIYNSGHYYTETYNNLGYEPTDSGGVQTSDISSIGSYGGFDVREMTSGSRLTTNGYSDGSRVIMTFSSGNIDHAVVVTGFTKGEDGEIFIKYHDPTTGLDGIREDGQYSSLYSVAPIFTDSEITGIIDSPISGEINNDMNYA